MAAQDRRSTVTIRLLLIVVSLGVAAIALIGSDALYAPAAAIVTFVDASPGLPQSLLFIALGAIPVTLVHELGHAIVARRLLGTPVTVTVGSVGKLAALQLGQIAVSLNAVASPTRVTGFAQFDAARARAGDVLLIALAGPAASALGLVCSLALLHVSPADGPLHDVIWATTLGGVFAVLNLIPFAYQERSDGPRLHTDGRLALDAARSMHALR